MRSLIVLVLLAVTIPLCSFGGDKRERKDIVGKWQIDAVKRKTKVPFSSGDDWTKRYAGDIMTFFEDGTMEYFKKSLNVTYKGKWEFGTAYSSHIGTGTPGAMGSGRVTNATSSLEVDLIGPNNQRMRFQGSDRRVNQKKLFYVVTKKDDGPVWFYWVRAEGDADTGEDTTASDTN